MFRLPIFALICALFFPTFTMANNTPLAEREFILNKDFTVVTSLAALEQDSLYEGTGNKVLNESPKKLRVTYSFIDGWIFNLDRTLEVNMIEAGNVKLSEKSVLIDGKLTTFVTLNGEDDFFDQLDLKIFMRREEDKTRVNVRIWMSTDKEKRFWLRVMSKLTLRKLELHMREAVGDPLPDKNDGS